jgi:hypothetical protein
MSCALEGEKTGHCDVSGHENVESDNPDLTANATEVKSEPVIEMRIFLNINTTKGWQLRLMKRVKSGTIVRICGIKEATSFHAIKEAMSWVKSFMNESNLVEIDLSEMDESRKYGANRFIVEEIETQRECSKKIHIRVIASMKLPEFIKESDIGIVSPEVICKEKHKNYSKKN